MKLFNKARSMGLVALLIGAGTLLAQPAKDGKDKDPTELPVDVSAKASIDLKLSITEMITRSADMFKQVKTDLRHVAHLQEVARKQKDIIKLTCVNDKLITMKGEANVFDNARHELESLAEATNDDRLTVYPATSTAADRVHKLRVEADTCVGEPELSAESENQVNDPGLPDPWNGNPFDDGLEPPGYASPFN
jgi:hypothetical protein